MVSTVSATRSVFSGISPNPVVAPALTVSSPGVVAHLVLQVGAGLPLVLDRARVWKSMCGDRTPLRSDSRYRAAARHAAPVERAPTQLRVKSRPASSVCSMAPVSRLASSWLSITNAVSRSSNVPALLIQQGRIDQHSARRAKGPVRVDVQMSRYACVLAEDEGVVQPVLELIADAPLLL